MCLIKVYKINLELFPYPHKNRLVTMQLAENTIEKLKVMTKTNCYFESPIFNLEMAENKSQNLKLLPYTHFQNRVSIDLLQFNWIKIQWKQNFCQLKWFMSLRGQWQIFGKPFGQMRLNIRCIKPSDTPRKIQLQ